MEDFVVKLHAAVVTTDVDSLQVQASIPWHVVTCQWMQGGHFTILTVCIMYCT
jgi:hypothetical protein